MKFFYDFSCIISSKINVTPKVSEKLQLTAALCNNLTAVTNLTFVIMGK